MTVPSQARAVIIGGGVVGCSIAYHLGKLGWRDVVLLERKQLTCGTTWHAAGLIAQLRATQNMTRLAKYSQELYFGLEAETGVATGFKRNGSITVALSDERMEELRRSAAMACAFGVEIDEISPTDIAARYPGLSVADVVGGDAWPGWIDVLARGGRYTCSGAIAGPMADFDLRTMYLRDLTFTGSTVIDLEVMPSLIRYIEAGVVKPVLAATYPLSELHAAQEAFVAKAHTGNIVVCP